MPKPRLSRSLILALALAGGALAGQDPAPRASALNGTAWTLASLPGHDLLPAHPGTLRIDGNRPGLRAADGTLQVTATPGGDAHAGTGHASGATAAYALRLPATFRGDLPCADCEAIRHHLDLWPDGVFHLRREWLSGDLRHDALGRWRVDPARRAILLQDGGEMPLQFEIKGIDRLRLLDLHGRPIASTLPYELMSKGSLTPTDLKLPLAGEMVYFADAARFTECLTGRNYPMAMEGAFQDAERAYLAARSAPAAPLYVTFEGAIVPRPKMEGDGLQPTIVVNRFIAAWPNERCERAKADASLVNTYWRIVRLAGDAVRAAEGRREPHLILRGDGRQQTYTATVGCDRLAGSYALEGELIGIAPAAATRIACPSPLDALEAKLRNALDRAARWQILGKTLELFDVTGAQTMLLEAVYL